MNFASVCSGIGAPELAWHGLGWESAFASEIDAFPRAVFAHRFPGVPLHGDFTRIEGHDGPVDLLVGGTPCQSFSVAGKRLGLDDPRGNLALEFLALARRIRARWIVWENVPGVLSSNGGRDFAAFLGLVAECRYGWAYRMLDAQYFGVPQRRRRVILVGHTGDDWQRAAAVLFEPEGLRGDTAPRREAREGIAGTIRAGSGGGCGPGPDEAASGQLIASHDPAMTLTAREYKGALPEADLSKIVAFDARQRDVVQYGDRAGPLDTDGYSQAIAFDPTQITSKANYSQPKSGDPCHPIAAGAHPPAIAVSLRGREGGATAEMTEGAAPALRASQGGGDKPHVLTSMVRRLTPRECERLQGFPDDFTLVPWRKGMAPDGPRYKALGNSMAVPVMRWVGERIDFVNKLEDIA